MPRRLHRAGRGLPPAGSHPHRAVGLSECTGLAEVTLPTGLTHTGDYAFNGCTGLAQVSLPPGLTHIGESAFYGCEGLTQVTLPAGLTYIGDRAFKGCRKIAAVLVTPDPVHRRGPPPVLHTDAARRLTATATVQWAQHTLTLATWAGDVVGSRSPPCPARSPLTTTSWPR